MAEILHTVQIAAAPEDVYPLTATAAGLRQWWAEDVVEADGMVHLGFFDRATVYRLRLETSNPPLLTEWVCESGDEWNGSRIIFRPEPFGHGTLLRFAHDEWRSETEYFVSCNTTWGELMYRLKSAAEGRPRGPLFLPHGLSV